MTPSHGQIVRAERSDRANRWGYYGLHGLDFAFLYNNRPLWDIAGVSPLLGPAQFHDAGPLLSTADALRAYLVGPTALIRYVLSAAPEAGYHKGMPIRILLAVLLAVFVLSPRGEAAQAEREVIDLSERGPQVGDPVPDFTLQDQYGATWTRDSLLGDNGTMLVFIRSADW